jgi:hypothetical protein
MTLPSLSRPLSPLILMAVRGLASWAGPMSAEPEVAATGGQGRER